MSRGITPPETGSNLKVVALVLCCCVPRVAADPGGGGDDSHGSVRKISTDCPTPTRRQGEECVLDGDVVIGQTLELASDTHLNCKGHKLSPTATGTPQMGTTPFQRSVPELAILLNQAYRAKVQDCVIGDAQNPFDFGVFILNSKAPPDRRDESPSGNKILGNTITGRYSAITVVKSDENLIADNKITFGVAAPARAILVYRDSDRNKVVKNVIRADTIYLNPSGPIPVAPQAPNLSSRSRGIISVSGSEAVDNFIYDGQLTQVPLTPAMIKSPLTGTYLGTCSVSGGPTLGTCSGNAAAKCADSTDCGLSIESMTSDFTLEENVFEGNDIDYLPQNRVSYGVGAVELYGIIVGQAVNSRITGNSIRNASVVIDPSGAGATQNLTLAGTCSLDSTRWCGSNSDCDIPGFDMSSKGTCQGARAYTINGSLTVNIAGKGIVVENNLAVDNDYGIQVTNGSINFSVIGNDVSGGNVGLQIANQALESTIVADNRLHDNRFGLVLNQGNGKTVTVVPTGYGSSVTLNDITGNTRLPIAAAECSNFPPLYCFDVTDCDNSCQSSSGTCRLTGKPCGTSHDCTGPQGATSNGICNIPIGKTKGTCSTDTGRSCAKNSDCAVTCNPQFSFNAELSYQGRGNYWGLTCAQGGFLPSLSPLPSQITDSHPYGQPVAGLDDDALPATCY